jgi:hypothetical protein
MKIAGSGSASGSISQKHGSADPDPHQNVMDPEHCFRCFKALIKASLLSSCLIEFGSWFHGSTTLTLCPSEHMFLSVHALLSPALSLSHFGFFSTRRDSRQKYKGKIYVSNIRKISVGSGLAQSYGSLEFRTDPDLALDSNPPHWINLCVIDVVVILSCSF